MCGGSVEKNKVVFVVSSVLALTIYKDFLKIILITLRPWPT